MTPMATVCATTDHAHAPSSANTVVTLHGDLDATTAPALREHLLDVLRPGMRLLVLDLSQVWFCDAAGAAVLIGAQRRAVTLGIAVRLAGPRSRVAKVLRSTGLDRRLAIHSTLSDALTIGFGGAAPAESEHVPLHVRI